MGIYDNFMTFLQKRAKYIVLIGVISGSFSGNFARITVAPPMVIGFFRLVFALPILLIPVLRKSEKRGELKKAFTDIKFLVPISIAAGGLYGHYMCIFKAVKMTTMASAATLMSLHPLIVIFISYVFFKRRVGFKAVLGIVVALTGVAIIAGMDYSFESVGAGGVTGDILAFSSGVLLAFYFIFGKFVRDKGISADVYIVACFGICVVLFAITIFITDTKAFSYAPKDYMYIFGMAMLCQVFAHTVFNWAFAYLSDVYVSAWQTMEGVFTIIIAFFMFGEIPATTQIIGGIITFGGLIYFNFHNHVDSGEIKVPVTGKQG